MLIIGFIRAAFAFVNWVLSAFPVANLTMPWLSNVRDFWSIALQADAALPIHEMIDAAAIYLGLVFVLSGGAVIKKIWSVVPLIGGGT